MPGIMINQMNLSSTSQLDFRKFKLHCIGNKNVS